jgi:putative tryptophan/tyrosine transport system substrate-binding protein
MKRREFITLLGIGAVAWPLTARAQQPALPVIGFLHPLSPERAAIQLAAFRQGLKETGFVEGQNVAIEYRWAESQYDRLPALAADLVRLGVAVIAAPGGGISAQAAKAATSTIPIVFNGAADPVKSGLVASFNRPDGNLTGYIQLDNMLVGKQLGLLQKLIPDAAMVAVLVNPDSAAVESLTRDVQEAAHSTGQQLLVLKARAEGEFEAAFATMAQQKAEALLVASEPFFFSQRNRLAALATQHRIPAIYSYREYAAAGGLMSYGASLTESYRQVGVYTGRILKGAKPTELPVIQSAKFEFVINLKTAKALGLTIPPSLLATADEVIE